MGSQASRLLLVSCNWTFSPFLVSLFLSLSLSFGPLTPAIPLLKLLPLILSRQKEALEHLLAASVIYTLIFSGVVKGCRAQEANGSLMRTLQQPRNMFFPAIKTNMGHY